jgi:hypothetical protein
VDSVSGEVSCWNQGDWTCSSCRCCARRCPGLGAGNRADGDDRRRVSGAVTAAAGPRADRGLAGPAAGGSVGRGPSDHPAGGRVLGDQTCLRRGGLAEVEWIASVLAAMDRGEPLPPPFDDRLRAWELVLSGYSVPHTLRGLTPTAADRHGRLDWLPAKARRHGSSSFRTVRLSHLGVDTFRTVTFRRLDTKPAIRHIIPIARNET